MILQKLINSLIKTHYFINMISSLIQSHYFINMINSLIKTHHFINMINSFIKTHIFPQPWFDMSDRGMHEVHGRPPSTTERGGSRGRRSYETRTCTTLPRKYRTRRLQAHSPAHARARGPLKKMRAAARCRAIWSSDARSRRR